MSIEDNFRQFCVKKWTYALDAESSNNWKHERVELPFDANNRQLNMKFKRELIGTSIHDYTFKLDTEYDFILAFVVAPADDRDIDEILGNPKILKIEGGSENGLDGVKTITFKDPNKDKTNDSVFKIDKDGDGLISEQELKDYGVPDADAKKTMEIVDSNRDGYINLLELL